LLRDNALFKVAVSVKRYLGKRKLPVLELTPCSVDLAPCDFVFLKIKIFNVLFESLDIRNNVTIVGLLKEFPAMFPGVAEALE
jgi:hypothetical protein